MPMALCKLARGGGGGRRKYNDPHRLSVEQHVRCCSEDRSAFHTVECLRYFSMRCLLVKQHDADLGVASKGEAGEQRRYEAVTDGATRVRNGDVHYWPFGLLGGCSFFIQLKREKLELADYTSHM